MWFFLNGFLRAAEGFHGFLGAAEGFIWIFGGLLKTSDVFWGVDENF